MVEVIIQIKNGTKIKVDVTPNKDCSMCNGTGKIQFANNPFNPKDNLYSACHCISEELKKCSLEERSFIL